MPLSPHSANLNRPFMCNECSKVFTRSVSTAPYLPCSVLIWNPPQENLQRHKRARKFCNIFAADILCNLSLIFSKVIMALYPRISNVLHARLNFLEGLVYSFSTCVSPNFCADTFAVTFSKDTALVAGQWNLQDKHLDRGDYGNPRPRTSLA